MGPGVGAGEALGAADALGDGLASGDADGAGEELASGDVDGDGVGLGEALAEGAAVAVGVALADGSGDAVGEAVAEGAAVAEGSGAAVAVAAAVGLGAAVSAGSACAPDSANAQIIAAQSARLLRDIARRLLGIDGLRLDVLHLRAVERRDDGAHAEASVLVRRKVDVDRIGDVLTLAGGGVRRRGCV